MERQVRKVSKPYKKTFTFFGREMFVDKNRSVAVVMGEKDNKKAIDTMKKQKIMEKMKGGPGAEVNYEEMVELKWEQYYEKVHKK